MSTTSAHLLPSRHPAHFLCIVPFDLLVPHGASWSGDNEDEKKHRHDHSAPAVSHPNTYAKVTKRV